MSKLLSKVAGFFRSRTQVGVDKAGNRYFTRAEEIDGFVKEKRFVIFKGEEDPTSVPVEWICWLNGQRKKPPTPQELLDLEKRREHVRLNVELLKKEEEERKKKEGPIQKGNDPEKSKVGGPDLKSFIQQLRDASPSPGKVNVADEVSDASDASSVRSSEPTGSGQTFKPGTWQPPS